MQNYRPLSGLPLMVKILITLNVVMYLFSTLMEESFHIDMTNLLGLHLPQSPFWRPWQYVTHMFMHGDLGHLFFNMFALFMFGRILESIWGGKRFLFFYFVCGIGAGALNSLIGWFEIQRMLEQYAAFEAAPTPTTLSDFVNHQLAHPAPWIWEGIDSWINHPDSAEYMAAGKRLFRQIIELKTNIPMIGASGAIFGILLAFGMLFPNTELYLMFIPIPIKAKYFVMGYGVLEIFLGLQNNASDNVAHFAHLGGMLFGYLLLKYWGKNRRTFY